MKVKASLLVGVDFFDKSFDKTNRLDLIEKLHRGQVLCLLALINNAKRTNHHSLYYSDEDIKNVLMFLFSDDEEIVESWIKRLNKYKKSHSADDITFFSRIGNLVAIEDVLTSKMDDDGAPIKDVAQIENVLYFLCAVNDEIVDQQKILNKTDLSKVELIVQGMGPSNEYQFSFNPIFDLYRAANLVDYIKNNEVIKESFTKYMAKHELDENSFFKWPFLYVSQIMLSDSIKVPICNINNDQDLKHFDYFIGAKFIQGKSTMECFNVKKYPVIPYKEAYLVLDIAYFVDKTNYSFINDFFFDQAKVDGINRKKYYGLIGYWFEDYLHSLFKEVIPTDSPHFLASPESLLHKTKDGEIELADLYLRENDQILVGQAKVSEINSKDKYSSIGDGVFTLDKSAFFKRFGLYQLVDTTLKYLIEHEELFDKEIPTNDIRVFPTLIVNERFFNNPVINLVFQEEFKKRMLQNHPEADPGKHEIDPITIGKYMICPVIILHISDIEMIKIHSSKGQYSVWNILVKHLNDSGLLYPIQGTIDSSIGQPYNDFLKGPILEYFKDLARG